MAVVRKPMRGHGRSLASPFPHYKAHRHRLKTGAIGAWASVPGHWVAKHTTSIAASYGRVINKGEEVSVTIFM